jgi:hypothetical protein
MKDTPTTSEVSLLADEVKDARADLSKLRTYGHAVRVQRVVKAMNRKADLIRQTFAVL